MKIFFFSAIFAVAIFCEAEGETYTEKDVRELFEEFWQFKLTNNPEFATRIGITDFDDQVNEYSLDSFRRRASAVQHFLNKAVKIRKSIDLSKNPTMELNLDLLESDLRQFVNGMQFHTYVWPLNIMEGPQGSPADIINIMKKETVKDMKNIISRIRLYKDQMEEMISLLMEGVRIGQTMNAHAFQKQIPVLKHLGMTKVEDSQLLQPFKKKPKGISEAAWLPLVREAKEAIINYVTPTYAKLAKYLEEEYLPHSRPKVGLSSVPNGAAFYQALCDYHTTSPDLTPDDIHKIGLSEVERINKLMDGVRVKVGFKGNMKEFRIYMRESPKFGFKDADAMLKHYKSIRATVEAKLPKFFGTLPTIKYNIEPIPAALAPSAPAAYYNEPSPNGRPGTFFLNTYNAPKRRSFAAEALFLHEAVPGHHLQIALKIENGSPVKFRKFAGMDSMYFQAPATYSMNTAFVEGWGLYAEYLGQEMGMYEDPYVYFGRLSAEMLRACRLVVDTGMHAKDWTRQQAIDYMLSNTADDAHDIQSEIDRYISIPGQALAYKIGEIKLRQLRKMTEVALGSKFDIRKFHDFLMVMGNIPLATLEKQVKRFIKEQLKN
jgi:uncharacterized protein (DUF885 family)